jgi:hypothetical protein
MPRRVSLPISDDKRLSLARARQKLGGHAASHGDAGQLVRVFRSEERRVGVVVWSDDASCDVCLERDRIVRVAKRETVPAVVVATSPLVPIAHAAKRFSALREGETVHVDGHAVKVVEKCRWGALVARADGTILAIAFQRLTPN